MNISPFLSMYRTCDEALQWTKEYLSRAGLHVVQTFDLHTARDGSDDCSCPNHGTQQCDCHLAVILVYGKADEPVTLILHGNDGQTWVSFSDDPRQRSDTKLPAEIRKALEKLPASIS